MEEVDAIICGAGPAGSAAALALARAGCSVALVERETFPRDKVCGDCLNPACWPVLEDLRVAAPVQALPGVEVRAVEFEALDGFRLRTVLATGERGPRAIRRSWLDSALAAEAAAAGAQLVHGLALDAVDRSAAGWEVSAGGRRWRARVLVAADGRNSTTLRLLGLAPTIARTARRVGLHAHLPRGEASPDTVRMFWRPEGYGGVAPVDAERINVAIAVRADGLESMKRWARAHFPGGDEAHWRAFAPLERAAVPPAGSAAGLFAVGDAARVVEPFTGEGIYYALATGALAGAVAAGYLHGAQWRVAAAEMRRRQARLYRGRLWWNALSRWFGSQPQAARWLLRVSARVPFVLARLTRKVAARQP